MNIQELEQRINTRIEELDLEYSSIVDEKDELEKDLDYYEMLDALEWRLEMVSRAIMELKKLLNN